MPYARIERKSEGIYLPAVITVAEYMKLCLHPMVDPLFYLFGCITPFFWCDPSNIKASPDGSGKVSYLASEYTSYGGPVDVRHHYILAFGASCSSSIAFKFEL